MEEVAEILSAKLSDSAKRARNQREIIAQQQNTISQLIGYGYPSRPIVEYALKTQAGSVLDIRKAEQEFFNHGS
jgi:hypothetical protein